MPAPIPRPSMSASSSSCSATRNIPATVARSQRPIDPSGVTPGTLALASSTIPRSDVAQRETRHDFAAGGRSGLFIDRHARLLPRHLRCPARSARCADRGQARHRTLKSDRLPGPADGFLGLERGRRVRQTTGRHRLVLRHRFCRQRHRRRARCARASTRWISTATATAPSSAKFWRVCTRTRLRSIILDSAYPVRPPDPWFATDWAAAWSGIDISLRSLAELQFARRNGHLAHAADHRYRPRASRSRARRRMATAILQPTTIDTASLIYLIDYAGFGPPVYRDLDAAARAWLESEDRAAAAAIGGGGQTPPASTMPEDFSYGLYEAVTCSDYPMLYDLDSREPCAIGSTRPRFKMRANTGPDLFAPFTSTRASTRRCTSPRWTRACRGRRRPQDLAPGAPGAPLPPSVQLPAGADLGAFRRSRFHHLGDRCERDGRRNFPNAVHVVVPNLGHVVTDSDEIGCTLDIVHRFVKSLDPGRHQLRTASAPRAHGAAVRAIRRANSHPCRRSKGDKIEDAQRRIAAAGSGERRRCHCPLLCDLQLCRQRAARRKVHLRAQPPRVTISQLKRVQMDGRCRGVGHRVVGSDQQHHHGAGDSQDLR